MRVEDAKKILHHFNLSLSHSCEDGERWAVNGKDLETTSFPSLDSACQHYDQIAKQLLTYSYQIEQIVNHANAAVTARRKRIKKWLLTGNGIKSSDIDFIRSQAFHIPQDWRHQAEAICQEFDAPLSLDLLNPIMKKKADSIR